MRTNGTPDSSESSGLPHTAESPASVAAVQAALDRCPAHGTSPVASVPNPWHDLLHNRLCDEPLPALIANDTITPAASLWTGSRLWVEAFRAHDLRPGDRLVIGLPPSTAFVQVLVAALWEQLTVVPAPPDTDAPSLLAPLDARAAVTPDGGPHAWASDEYAGPRSTPDSLRPLQAERAPDVRFLLRTSGTHHGRWVALSDRNVLSVLASHLPHFALRNARVLSVLPWSHCFGLVLDLLPALLSGAELIRDPDRGRDPERLVSLRKAWGTTHLSAVPLTFQRLCETANGRSLLHDLQGGIVGGAPVSAPLAEQLSNTALRAGYGQTEAAPGITLGPRGTWRAHYIGTPVGCSVTMAPDGELCFEGPNACVGFWRDGALNRADPTRTVHTGDLVERTDDGFIFRGRKDAAFKLSNGRLVQAGALESDLKTTFDALQDALLFTPDGDNVAVALCTDAASASVPDLQALRSTLGSLGSRLVWCTTLPPEAWQTHPKGTVDRPAMSASLAEAYHSRTPSSP
ncbi:MAG: class I adenylate-forming enzyme family protein [Salinibacter sp.]